MTKISIVRADDLLVLDFEFVNMNLDASPGHPPRLVRTDTEHVSSVIVEFPAQHIREASFGDSDGDVLHLPEPPVSAVMANRSRLVFNIPDHIQSIALTMPDLLAWTRLSIQVPPNAPLQPHDAPAAAEPALDKTAIELPYQIVLSPDDSASWRHSGTAVTHGGRSELWHTRLALLGSGEFEPPPTIVRAVGARKPLATPSAVLESLPTADQCGQIADLSSNFTPRNGYIPPPLEVHHLMLSALGGWIDVTGNWHVPHFPVDKDVKDWHQVVSMGRDQFVRIVSTMHCMPFRHRGAVIEIAERQLAQSANGHLLVNYVIKQTHLAILEPLVDYSIPEIAAVIDNEGRELPFQRVRVTTLVTPPLQTEVPAGSFPMVDGTPFQFHFVADNFGQTVTFSMPLMLAGDTTGASSYNSAPETNRQAQLDNQVVIFADPGPNGDTRLKTKSITFGAVEKDTLTPKFLPKVESAEVTIPAVDGFLGSSGVPDTMVATFHTSYTLHGLDSPENRGQVFMQFQSPSQLNIPAAKGGGIVTPNMSVNGISRALGPVGGVENIVHGTFDPKDVFNSVADARLLGAVSLGDLIKPVPALRLDPSLPTADPQKDSQVDLRVPHLIQTRNAQFVTTSYRWSPDVNRINDPDTSAGPEQDDISSRSDLPIVTTRMTRLKIDASSIASLDGTTPPSFVVDGTLENFALNLMGVVIVNFTFIEFHSENGQKLTLSTGPVQIAFTGALSVVNTLAELLPREGFGTGAAIDVTPEGITTGYTLSIPAAGLGAFSLENISLAAKLLLPLPDLPGLASSSKPASLRLAFSKREHPFLVTMSMIGGGGFLAVALNTGGIEQIEGSLELGGNITVSLGVVEANVHAMIGIYFGLRQGTGAAPTFDFTAFIRIGGSVDLLGVVSVSIELYVGLTFQSLPKSPGLLGRLTGKASLTIGVHVLFVDESFTLTLEREFDIPARTDLPLVGGVSFAFLTDPSFDDMMLPDDWHAYCEAFA